VLLTARAECYHVSHPHPFRESVRRLQAYAAAGADVLFAPGPQSPAEIKALVEQETRTIGSPGVLPNRAGSWKARTRQIQPAVLKPANEERPQEAESSVR
jgi:hypothetical protein